MAENAPQARQDADDYERALLAWALDNAPQRMVKRYLRARRKRDERRAELLTWAVRYKEAGA